MKINNQTFDIIALASSMLCALHCIAVPVILSFSTLAGLHFLQNPWIEWAFIIGGLLLANLTLLPSYKKVHERSTPLAIAFLGFFFTAISRLNFTLWWETGNTVLGACLVSYAHYRNWKLLRYREHIH